MIFVQSAKTNIMESTASENAVFHRMDLPVSKNAHVWRKTATTLKDACFRQKVNYGSKLICTYPFERTLKYVSLYQQTLRVPC